MIQEVMESDLGEVRSIIAREFPYAKETARKMEERIANGNVKLFKFMDNGKIAGFLDLEANEGMGKINAITVLNGFRGRGFGKKMLEFAIGFLKGLNVNDIRLIVRSENSIARKIYSDQGFITTGFLDKKIDGSIIEEMRLTPGQGFFESG